MTAINRTIFNNSGGGSSSFYYYNNQKKRKPHKEQKGEKQTKEENFDTLLNTEISKLNILV